MAKTHKAPARRAPVRPAARPWVVVQQDFDGRDSNAPRVWLFPNRAAAEAFVLGCARAVWLDAECGDEPGPNDWARAREEVPDVADAFDLLNDPDSMEHWSVDRACPPQSPAAAVRR